MRQIIDSWPSLCLKVLALRSDRTWTGLSVFFKILVVIAILACGLILLTQTKTLAQSMVLTAWRQGVPVPQPRGTAALLAFVADDYLYAIGGAWGPDRYDPRAVVYKTAYRTQVGPEGISGEWIRRARPLAVSVYGTAERVAGFAEPVPLPERGGWRRSHDDRDVSDEWFFLLDGDGQYYDCKLLGLKELPSMWIAYGRESVRRRSQTREKRFFIEAGCLYGRG